MTRGNNWKRRKYGNGLHPNGTRRGSSTSVGSVSEADSSTRSELKLVRREFGPEGWQLDESVWSRGLPDDVYCTILAHLPLSSFYQLRTVCKSWSLMPSDKSFLEACSRVGSRTPSLLLMGKDYCCAYEPAVNEWKSIPLSFFLPRDSEAATYVVSSAGGRVLLLRRCRLLLHNPLNNSLKLLPPMLDMDRSDLPTVFDIHIIGMFVSDNDGDEISILVMNKTTNFEEEFDSDYDGSEPIISQVYNSRADSWQMITDFEPPFKLSISSAAMVDAKLRFVISSFRHYPSCSSLSMYSVKPSSSTSWEKEKIRMPHLGLRLVAPHLFTYRGALLLVAALPTDETRNDRFPTWNNVTVWELSASSNPRGSDGHWNRVLEVGPKELNDELWNTSLESFFFLSDGDFIYFGSRSGSSLGMINLKSKTWRLLPLFPGITSHFTGSIEKMSLQTFLFQPRFDVVV